MEPPAKRLRILQSVEVDDTNPDYITAKQKQQQKFKGRLESIFAKYESMHESMSDEIDMRQNKVVVDRGHLRRLVRQVTRQETVLLDNLGLAAGQEPEDEPEKEQQGEESEDELAPTQPPKPSTGRTEKEQRTTVKGAHSPQCRSPGPQASSPITSANATATATVQPIAQQMSNTLNPAANLLQLVQFPQTPAGQQAQSSFYATLAQTINQAVQQAVAPLFSNILQNAPNVQPPFANAIPIPMTPVTNSDTITPATDPKWFFPPLSNEPHKAQVNQSSPIPVPAKPSIPNGETTTPFEQEYVRQEPAQIEDAEESAVVQMLHSSKLSSLQDEAQGGVSATLRPRRTSPRVEIQRKRERHTPKFHFTEEEDIYISKRKRLHKSTWREIRNSKERWKSWPLHAFNNRWHLQLKGKNLHLQDYSGPQDQSCTSEAEAASSSIHHLPTPSSLEYEESPTQDDKVEAEPTEKVISSRVHFDDDERELLSLAGADLDEEQLPAGNEDEDTFFPDTHEIILPSVELTDFISEDALQRGLSEHSPIKEVIPLANVTDSIEVKTETQLLSSTKRRKRQKIPASFLAVPDFEDETDVIDIARHSSAAGEGIFSCDICKANFKNAKNLQRHQNDPPSTHDKLRPKSNSIDLVGDNDDLQVLAPTTPRTKREFSTPPPTSFLFSTPAPQSRLHVELPSSGVESASGLSRKAYLKQIKQSWAKKSTPGPTSLGKRKSFHTLPRKRAWAGAGESDDELAL